MCKGFVLLTGKSKKNKWDVEHRWEAYKWYNEWLLSLSNPHPSKQNLPETHLQWKGGNVRLLKKET
jgi:hypothetical protein